MFSPRLDGGFFVQFFQISKKRFHPMCKITDKLCCSVHPDHGFRGYRREQFRVCAAAFGSVRKLCKFSSLIKQDE